MEIRREESPSQIEDFRVLTLRSALRMEVAGLKSGGRSAYAIVKAEFGFKGSKQKVLDQLLQYIQENNL